MAKMVTKNHKHKEAVWLIFYKQKAGKPTLTWSEAVDEALCFGWIDSIKKTLDEKRSIQFFSKRKPKSTWSKINKLKVQNLLDAGLMTQAGIDCIDCAKQNGSWIILDEVEELIIPDDLDKAFTLQKGSKEYFLSLSKTNKKILLQRIALAKTDATRQRRIIEIIENAKSKQKL
jgi:uncharacterized protein YdeI (YjbR/CyaY-like superfamily)